MRKLVKVFCLMLLIICIASLFTACSDNKEHKKISADYAALNNTDESGVSFKCYGEFDGVHVLLFDGIYPQALSSETVDGIVFCHSQIQTFTVYSKGEFCSLQEAFDNGLLTRENLMKVREKHKAEHKTLYDNYGEA